MPHDIFFRKLNVLNIFGHGEDATREVREAILLKTAIVLLDISSHNHLGTITKTCQKHLHLRRRRVLHLVAYDPGVFECAAAHIGQRANLHIILNFFWAYVLSKTVKHRTSPRFHLLLEGPGEKAMLLIDTYRGPRYNQTGHLTLDEGLCTCMTSQECLSSACWPGSYNNRNRGLEEIEVSSLSKTTRRNHAI